MSLRAAFAALALLGTSAIAQDAPPSVELDPRQEVRAQALAQEIRCVVCENEPVSQSSADMAVAMRAVIRERIAAGDSDGEVRNYFAARYGDFVLLNPRVSPATLALWGAPFVLILLGGGLLLVQARRRRAVGSATDLQPESGQERAALAALEALDRARR